ncbi:MAG TPA: M23 family metallopeptidase [Cyclobacteriaceae bacterium]|nr:M23 family metallopeptidase [Cyclobacteriaceae bacterium]
MAKAKYYYDKESCKYIRVKITPGTVILNTLGILSLTLIMAAGIVILYHNYFESPKEVKLKNELKNMEFYYDELYKKVNDLDKQMTDMAYRDDNIYRAVLGSEPIDKGIREAGVGGTDRYEDIRNKDVEHEELIVKLNESVDKLRRKVYIESKSHDEIIELAGNKEKLFAAIPAIQPIPKRENVMLASGFGIRIHPIYKVRKMHYGMDFAAPIGTPIYAAADGVIDNVEISFTGYGKKVEVDHGFGYRTRYAHMHMFTVKNGQHVKRGELIGYVGDTGLSTAPHLHYEVFINGTQVNPIHYFFNDLNPAEYAKIIELASIENQSLGM